MDLVTGGSGYLGQALVRHLVRSGRAVRVLDLVDARDRPAPVHFIQEDVRSREAVREAMRDVEHVYHTVARVPLTKSHRGFWDVNVGGTRIALEEAERAGVKAFVHTSSSAVFGAPGRCPIDERSPTRPVEAYGAAKLAAERLVAEAMRRGFPAAVIRPRTLVGHGRLGIFSILFDWIRRGKRIWIIGSGENLFQFLHCDDLVAAMVRAGQRAATGFFHVGTDRFGTLREDLGALIRHAGTRSRIGALPAEPTIAGLRLLDRCGLSPLAAWHYLTYHKPFYFDVRGTMDILGWKPRYGNVEMLCEAYDWYSAHGGAASGPSVHGSPLREGALRLLRWVS